MKHRGGHTTTNLSGELQYTSFVPSPLPPNPPLALDEEGVSLLVSASRAVAQLDSIAERIPNIDLFISMYVRKEALLSSQIEGTQATLDDILDPSATRNANRNVTDVINYIAATEYALERRKTLPLCNRLLREVHACLLQGVRGQERTPGEFRHSQNWIGGQGSTIRTASYVPPTPEDMNVALADLEAYLHAKDPLDPLTRAALVHYQFETIHPFLDGNGRIGRLLITLFLMEQEVLHSPALYVSYFLKRNRVEYYDRMMEVRRTGAYEQWVKFFLRALRDAAKDAVRAIDELSALCARDTAKVAKTGQRASAVSEVYEYLKSNPIIEVQKTADALGVSYNTCASAVQRLVDAGILEQSGKVGRTRVYSYEAYLAILRQDTE